MKEAVNHRPRTVEVLIQHRPIRVIFMVNRVTMGQVFLRVLPLSAVSIIPPIFHMYVYSSAMDAM